MIVAVRSITLALALGLFCNLAALAQSAAGWTMVWSDEFDGSGLPDPAAWSFETAGNDSGWGNGEDQYYTAGRTENARRENGALIITARREPIGGKAYSSARIATKGHGEWRYGRFEARMKLPAGHGIWPAFWMLPVSDWYGSWPASGEIDIMELFGWISPHETAATVHTGKYNHKIGTQKGGTFRDATLGSGFHDYAVEWFPDRLDFWFDNHKFFSFRKEAETTAVWPFDRPFYILLNNAVGGDWCRLNGGIGDTAFPQELVIDHVRVYKQDPGRPLVFQVRAGRGGKVTGLPDQGQAAFRQGIHLEAVAEPGWRFAAWSGDLSGTAAIQDLSAWEDLNALATFVPAGELLDMGAFPAGLTGWTSWVDTGKAQARFLTDGPGLGIKVEQAGTQDWQVQVNTAVKLVQGKKYRVRFTAMAGAEGLPLRVSLAQAHDAYQSHAAQTFTLGTAAREFQLDLTMAAPTDPRCRLEFDLGSRQGEYRILQASLTEQP